MSQDADDGQRPHRHLQCIGLLMPQISPQAGKGLADPRRLEIDNPDIRRHERQQLAFRIREQEVDPVTQVAEMVDQCQRHSLGTAAGQVRQEKGDAAGARQSRVSHCRSSMETVRKSWTRRGTCDVRE